MEIVIKDYTEKVLAGGDDAISRALERCGLHAEGLAQDLAPVGETGQLRNSITHKVQDNAVYVGTNLEYAPYVELGTGIYYPGGRKTPWTYQDANGEWHMTHGQRARPFLKPALADHADDYAAIIKDELSK